MSNENLKTKVVGQNTRLGTLGLLSLVDADFCGPPCDLSDLSVYFYKIGDGIKVSFYDMSCNVYTGNKYYDEMISYFENKNGENLRE